MRYSTLLYGMKYNQGTWWGGALLVGWLLAACTFPLRPTAPQPASHALSHGIDSTLPHAKGVLLQACAEEACELRVVDPDTGVELAGYAPLALGKYTTYVASPDGKTLATLVYPSNLFTPNGGPTDGVLQWIDLQAWRAITTTLTFNEGGGSPVFSPDSTHLALVDFRDTPPFTPLLHLVDVPQQRELAQLALDFRPSLMRFTPDGQSILLYGNNMGVGATTVNPQVYVAQVSAMALTIQWQTILPEHLDGLYNSAGGDPYSDPATSFTWQPAVVFAPDGTRLYIVHADQDRLTIVDFVQHTVQTALIEPRQSWFERWLALTARVAQAKVFNGAMKQAVIAPDGKTLYVAGFHAEFTDGAYVETPLGVQVIDLTQMVELAHLDSAARSLSLSPDGRDLYLHGWENDPTESSVAEWTELVDTTTFQLRTKLENRAIAVGQRLNGQPILFGTVTRPDGQWEAATLDPVSLAVTHTWHNQEAGWWGWFVTP